MRYLVPSDYPSESIVGNHLYRIDLTPYFEKFCKETHKDQRKACEYRVSIVSGTQYSKPPFRDGRFNFVLRKREPRQKKSYRGRGVACIGFNIREDAPIVVVNQIQGVKGEVVALSPLRWEQMLLQLLVDWAKANCYTDVYIEPYFRKGSPRYYITPKRLGFKNGSLNLA